MIEKTILSFTVGGVNVMHTVHPNKILMSDDTVLPPNKTESLSQKKQVSIWSRKRTTHPLSLRNISIENKIYAAFALCGMDDRDDRDSQS